MAARRKLKRGAPHICPLAPSERCPESSAVRDAASTPLAKILRTHTQNTKYAQGDIYIYIYIYIYAYTATIFNVPQY